MFHALPVEIEAGEVLAEPVGIIRGFAIFPRGREELPPSVRQRSGFTTNANDESQLGLVEEIELFVSGMWGAGWGQFNRDGPPLFAGSND